MSTIIVAGLLLGHSLVHVGYLTPEPAERRGAPAWPFHLDRSWVLGRVGLDRATLRALGTGLVVVAIAGFTLAAIASLGVAPSWLWSIGVALGAAASLATLSLYFHPWLVLGIVIDVVLLWSVAIVGWIPDGLGTLP